MVSVYYVRSCFKFRSLNTLSEFLLIAEGETLPRSDLFKPHGKKLLGLPVSVLVVRKFTI